VEHPKLVGGERSDDGMEQAAVVEENEVAFVPVLGVDELRGVSGESSAYTAVMQGGPGSSRSPPERCLVVVSCTAERASL
jgi:hypothetical protein